MARRSDEPARDDQEALFVLRPPGPREAVSHVRLRPLLVGDVVDIGAVGGKRKQGTKSGFKTKAEAVTALAEVQAAVAKGQYVEPDKVTVAQFLTDEWLPAIESTIRPSTLASYRLHVERYVVPRIGEARLQQVGGSDLNALYADLLASGRVKRPGGLSPTSVRRVHATFHRAFRDAFRWGRLIRSPADAADAPRAQSRSTKLRTWSADELRQFLHQTANDRLAAVWHLAASTGLRRGELLGLRWADVDLGAARLSVRRTLVAIGYEVQVSEPKTKRSRRQVELDRGTVEAVRAHRKRQLEERIAWGPEDGQPLHPDRLTKLFDRHVRRSELPRIRLHDLRHTHATLALEAGVPSAWFRIGSDTPTSRSRLTRIST